ncbi:MAG: metallophosphoesterase [Planctomycetaceae bacterium]|jgi:predicted MPP superfamily phosphohydrolase|nr:metallophosphoesterase [Planctomycetaceae bacterium]
MDTIPFHFMMFALDILLLIGFAFLLSWRSATGKSVSATVYDGLPYISQTNISQPAVQPRWSVLVDFFCLGLFGFVGIAGIRIIAKVFDTNKGQCMMEGLTYHGSIFLLIAACLLLRKHRIIVAIFSGLLGLLIFGIGFDMLVWEPYHLVVENYVIETPKLKKPLKIVFVADIQTDRIGNYERRTLKLIQQQQADLIILGGDYLQYYQGTQGVSDLPERFDNLFREIPLTAPLGVYAIEGNIGPNNDLFKNTGVEMISESTILENLGTEQGLGPIDLVLLSLNDTAGSVGERGLTDTGNFIVMAGHRPNFAIKGFRSQRYPGLDEGYQDAKRAPDLMLAGHTHGGQVVLPFYGPIGLGGDGFVKQIPQNMLSGMFTFANGGRLLITRGSGMERGWAPRIRFLCKPEISVIHLVPAEKNTGTEFQ